MTQEDKNLLLIDLCARLPYGVKVDVSRVEEWKELTLTPFILANYYDDIEKVKPYLRPMSSMTEKEANEWHETTFGQRWITFDNVERCVDWLVAHHFDFRGLISMGLALEAPDDMYKTE